MFTKLRKFILIFLFGLLLISSFSAPTFAAEQNTSGYEACEYVLAGGSVPPGMCDYEKNEEDAYTTVGKVLDTIYLWIGIIAVIFIVIGGVNYTTSQGDPNKTKKAKTTILYAVIGLIVSLLAFGITSFVLNALEGKTEGGGGGGGGGVVADAEVEAITVTAPNTEIKEGESMQLKVEFTPANVANTALTYTSSNPSVATVGLTGNVTAKSPGTTTITVKSRNGKTATIELTIIEIIKPESVTVSPDTIELEVGQSKTVEATIAPEDAENKTITWSSSNKKIASVNKKGKVTANKAGTATITAKTFNGKTATAKVTVTKKPEPEPTTPTSPTSPPGGQPGSDPVPSTNGLNTYAGMDYWLTVPSNATNNMPIIVFLHGSGERGKTDTVGNVLPQSTSMRARNDFISVIPVAPELQDWMSNASTVKAIIDHVADTYKANKSRIYIFGFSMGGHGTFRMVNNYTTYFRAAVPMSGCPYGDTADNLSKVPMRFIVGTASDEMANFYGCMSDMRDQIRARGGSVDWVTMNNASHAEVQWNTNYNEIFNWLLSH